MRHFYGAAGFSARPVPNSETVGFLPTKLQKQDPIHHKSRFEGPQWDLTNDSLESFAATKGGAFQKQIPKSPCNLNLNCVTKFDHFRKKGANFPQYIADGYIISFLPSQVKSKLPLTSLFSLKLIRVLLLQCSQFQKVRALRLKILEYT